MKRLQTFLALGLCLTLTGLSATALPRTNAQARHPASIDDLLSLHELGGYFGPYVAPSPDGAKVALFDRVMDLTGNRYVYRLIVVDIATGATRAVADGGDIILESTKGRRSGVAFDRRPVWSADGRSIYYLNNVDDRAEIWCVHLDGGATAPVVQGPADVRNFALTRDGSSLIYATLTPRQTMAAQRLAEQRDGFRVDDNFSALYSLLPLPDEASGAAVTRLSLASGATNAATADERALVADPAEHGDFVRPLILGSTAERPELSIYAGASADAQRCNVAPCHGWLNMAWAAQDETGQPEIIFARNEGHANMVTSIYAWLVGASTARLIRSGTDQLADCAVAAQALICIQDDTTEPNRLVRIDLRTGALRVLYDPNPQWRSVTLPRTERIDHTDANGDQSFAYVVYPLHYRQGRSYPLVLVQYRSRGFLNAGVGGESPIYPLSAAGFFVLSVDRPEFRNLSRRLSFNELLRHKELDDSEHTITREANSFFVDTLVQRGLVDPHRVGITGMSNGAQTVFDSIVAGPAFAAAVASNGPTDPVAWNMQPADFRAQRIRQRALAAPWDTTAPEWQQWWDRNTPALHVDRIRTPLMLNLPESDALLAFPLITRLHDTTTPLEAYIYPGAYHLKWRPSQILAVQQRTVDWMSFWLQGHAPADPETARRWRQLRDRMATHAASPAAGAPAPP
ncbi:MAG: Atxe2 family lasso peptide isopeptidase [Terricaulis sp.]